jgi:hypothetical protein
MRSETSDFMVGKMTTRNIGVLAAAAMLAACASTNGPAGNQSAGLRSAEFAVQDNGSAVRKTAEVNEAMGSTVPTIPGESKLMRIYWFLGGR